VEFNGKRSTASPWISTAGEGYRAWTHKQNFPATQGRWQVRVLTEDGQVIGVLRFKVTDSTDGQPKVGRIVLLRRNCG
jgi:antibiotic biosynthesis monooxygenase (ABM) superfamily enzyme